MEGLEEFFKKLDGLSHIEKECFGIVDECGEFVRDDARMLSPVDKGDLRKSITHTTIEQNGEIVSMIHTNSDHALYVEFGTGPVGAANHEGISPNVNVSYTMEKWRGRIPGLVSDTDDGIRYISGQPAKPYLYPALKDNEEQIEEKIKNDLKKIMEEKAHG